MRLASHQQPLSPTAQERHAGSDEDSVLLRRERRVTQRYPSQASYTQIRCYMYLRVSVRCAYVFRYTNWGNHFFSSVEVA